jgi:hypothetical protein
VTNRIGQYFDPFFAGEDLDILSQGKLIWRIVLVFIGIFGFTFCLTSLYLAMRGIMPIGGFVAYGGPYHIAHEAPNWVWIFPASIMTGVIFIFLNQYNARRVGGLNLLALLWPAVFLSLGENFLEFGFNPPGQEPGIALGWIICGVAFMVMGGWPLIIIIKNGIRTLRKSADHGRPVTPRRSITITVIIINLAAVFFGLYLGRLFFQMVIS